MNAPSHTPGPWQLARSDNDRCRVDIETVERGNDLPDQGNHIAVAYWGCPTEEANARLIAAAPELLAACRAILACWTAHEPIDRPPGYYLAIESIRAAIAKAEGRPA